MAATAAVLARPTSAWSGTAEFEDTISRFFQQKGRSAPHSLAMSLARNGELVLAKGYGEATPGTPAHEYTVYHVGSLTKQFTAAAILKLIGQRAEAKRTGRLIALDENVSGILPGFDHWSKDPAEPVTVRRLLNMTSNLPNITRRPPGAADPWGAVASHELLSALRSYAPHGWPDTFEYSNTSYFLLSEVIEQASLPKDGGAATYKQAMRAIFKEAGMHATGFIRDYRDENLLAKPHYDRQPVFIKGDWLKGSGDVASSALDMFFWNKALMEGRVVKPELRERLFAEEARIGPSLWYGMGFFVEHRNGRDEYTHTGSVPGYSSFNGIYRTPDGGKWVSVTLLTNTGGLEGLDALGADLADLLLAE
jgi:CubicO group peptidase (beta-lactamase class C family)